MKIAVIGAGIIGITTAYALVKDGHEVSVLERRGAAAEEGSFANSGILSSTPMAPWAMACAEHPSRAVFALRLPLAGAELSWAWKNWRAMQAQRKQPTQALHALARDSHARLMQWSANLKMDYERSSGLLLLLRGERDSRALQPRLQALRDTGLVLTEISPMLARQIEPALNPDADFFSALHLPNEEVGNCRQFALLLKAEAQRLGVRFVFHASVTCITPAATPTLGINLTLAGVDLPQYFDAAVLCAGAAAQPLLRPLGLKLALGALYGYSVSVQVREDFYAPRSAVLDARHQVAISRLGNRVRVTGSVELGGRPTQRRLAALVTLYKVLHDWFPGAAHMSTGVQEWKGTRPLLPDGRPLLGASGTPGLWLNLGHGDDGWALSCACAQALSDAIAARSPSVDIRPFSLARGG